MPTDFERRQAIADLLAQSDPPELPRRSHRVRLKGKPERYAMLPWLSSLFVQQQLVALEERRASHLERVRRNIQARLWSALPSADLRHDDRVCNAAIVGEE